MSNIESLRPLLEEASKSLPKVTWRRMFGCDAAFANGTIFGLIWKTGRIGVKLPEPSLFEELMEAPGSVPWTAGKMKMSHWVLVPETFHAKKSALTKWVEKAHELALKAPPKVKAKRKSE